MITGWCIIGLVVGAVAFAVLMGIIRNGALEDRRREQALFMMQKSGYTLKWNEQTQGFDVIDKDGDKV